MVRFLVAAKREYYDRLCPLIFYTDTKFVQRYRLSKDVVKMIIQRFVDTQLVKVPRGKHAIPHSLKVSIFLPYIIYI